MLFPTTLQEMISMAPDALLNSASFSYIACVLNVAYRKEKIGRKDIMVLALLLTVICLTKIAYLGAVLLVYLIPAHKMRKCELLLLRVIIPSTVILLNLLQLSVASKILMETDYGFSSGTGFRGAASKIQEKFILSHPVMYIGVMLNTIIHRGPGYIGMCVGMLLSWVGSKTEIRLPFAIPLLFLLICLYTTASGRCDFKLRKRDTVLFLLCFVSGCTLILTSEYVSWTPLYAKIVEGVHGKYFISVVPCLLMSVFYLLHRQNIKHRGGVPCTIVALTLLTLNAHVAVDVCESWLSYFS